MKSPKDWTDRIHPDDRPLFKYTLAEHLKGNTPRFSMELRYRDGAGNWRWARQAGIAVRGPDGRARRMVGAAGDVTEAKRDDEAMTASADLLKVMSRSTFELQTVLDALVSSATKLCEADAALIFRRENSHYRLAAQHGLNKAKDEFMRGREILPGRETLVGRTALERRIIHIPDVTADTDYHWPEASRRRLPRLAWRSAAARRRSDRRDNAISGLVIGAAIVVRMLSERNERLLAELRAAALADPLTGLPNRRALESAFVREAARQTRSGRPFALLLLDLDRFKQLNDEHGHKAGDPRAQRDRRTAPEPCPAVRHGRADRRRRVRPAARRDRQGSRPRRSRRDSPGRSTSTPGRGVAGRGEHSGSASSEEDGATMDALMRHADMRLYAAKRQAHARLPAYPLREAS